MNNFELDINGFILDKFDFDFLIFSIEKMPTNPEDLNNFITLIPENYIQNSVYLKSSYKSEKFLNEIRIKENNNVYCSYFNETSSIEDVIKMYSDYYSENKTPNISLNWNPKS